jgi:hypothetical protein
MATELLPVPRAGETEPEPAYASRWQGSSARSCHAGQGESVLLQTRPVLVGELAHRFELPQHEFQVRGPQ